MAGKRATEEREQSERHAREYILSRSVATQKYHGFSIPDFLSGCKRRIFDPGYLGSLNVEAVPDGINAIDETGIINVDGTHTSFDLIVLATCFKVQHFLTPIELVGKDGKTLNEQWKEDRGAQAYMGSCVHNFPNFGILFGSNEFPAHNSALLACEVQVEYIARCLLADYRQASRRR
ncbi:hypothetical protein PM082_021553 [Marasmius tenuissimus]|nr:hypothetical protein PM082_021553 [Marasmius tenuissimus]